MSDLAARLRAIHERVERLVKERDDLRGKVAQLQTAAREHQHEAGVLQARISELERENEVLRTSAVTQRGDRQREAKQQIDELVNEIDRCLALLNG